MGLLKKIKIYQLNNAIAKLNIETIRKLIDSDIDLVAKWSKKDYRGKQINFLQWVLRLGLDDLLAKLLKKMSWQAWLLEESKLKIEYINDILEALLNNGYNPTRYIKTISVLTQQSDFVLKEGSQDFYYVKDLLIVAQKRLEVQLYLYEEDSYLLKQKIDVLEVIKNKLGIKESSDFVLLSNFAKLKNKTCSSEKKSELRLVQKD